MNEIKMIISNYIEENKLPEEYIYLRKTSGETKSNRYVVNHYVEDECKYVLLYVENFNIILIWTVDKIRKSCFSALKKSVLDCMDNGLLKKGRGFANNKNEIVYIANKNNLKNMLDSISNSI